MMSFNRITAWRLKTGTHPQNILKWGIIVQFAANLLMIGFGVVAVFAAFVGFGAVRDVFSRYARFGRCEHSSLLYELFQRRGRQRKCRLGRVPIPYRRIGRYGNNLAAQWFCLGDGRYDVEFDCMRHCAVVGLLASGLDGKR